MMDKLPIRPKMGSDQSPRLVLREKTRSMDGHFTARYCHLLTERGTAQWKRHFVKRTKRPKPCFYLDPQIWLFTFQWNKIIKKKRTIFFSQLKKNGKTFNRKINGNKTLELERTILPFPTIYPSFVSWNVWISKTTKRFNTVQHIRCEVFTKRQDSAHSNNYLKSHKMFRIFCLSDSATNALSKTPRAHGDLIGLVSGAICWRLDDSRQLTNRTFGVIEFHSTRLDRAS